MDTDAPVKKEEPESGASAGEDAKDEAAAAPGSEKKKSGSGKEPTFEVLGNMTRVVPAQLRFVKFRDSSRYAPVKRGAFAGGIVILHDRRPDEPVELVGDAAAAAETADAAPAPTADATAAEADASAAATSTPQTPTGAAPMDTA
ncbi:hypothetical protein HK405_007616 [Cladochytrium tenue]|nr:hypothetical protein HK405_007616 [Cladochytrium tenue]